MVRIPKLEEDCKFNGRIKYYPNGECKITYCNRHVFNPYGYERVDSDHRKEELQKKKFEWIRNPWTGKLEKAYYINNIEDLKQFGREKEKGIRTDNLKRTKDKALDICMANDFNYFITLTLDKEKISRTDTGEIGKKLGIWLRNRVFRYNWKYIIFPEYHKDKESIHFHGLVSGEMKLTDSGHKTKNGQTIYNADQWTYGWSTVIELDHNVPKIAGYVMKYMAKGNDKIFGKFYFSGGKLNRSVPTEYFNADFQEVDGKEYEPFSGLRFKYKTMKGENLNDCNSRKHY
jgi:hypothetical protein